MENQPTYKELEQKISDLENIIQENADYKKNLERNKVIGSIGHEFNNILMGIQGNLSLIFLDTNKFDIIYDKLKDIEKNINKGVKLTERLFDFISGRAYSNDNIKSISSSDYYRIKGEINKYSKQAVIANKYYKEIHTEYNIYEAIKKGSKSVLLIDDDFMILDIGKRMLEKIGLEVITAIDGFKAIKIYEKAYEKIDVVIIDMIMPELSGIDTYYRLKKINPEIKTLLSSGYRKNKDIDKIIDKGNSLFIQKPFNMEYLTQKISEIIK